MKMPVTVCLLFTVAAFGAEPCHPRITKTQAIDLAKKQLAHDWGPKVLSNLGPYTAELDGCIWKVVAVTPAPDGDFYIEVGAETGKASIGPHLRTDPKKLRIIRRPQ